MLTLGAAYSKNISQEQLDTLWNKRLELAVRFSCIDTEVASVSFGA
jgi:hypothetical protein